MFEKNPGQGKLQEQELAEKLREEAVRILGQEGSVHMFDTNAVESILFAPIFILAHLSEFTLHPIADFRRFCQLTQASYLHKVSREGAMVLFADDGNPAFANIAPHLDWPNIHYDGDRFDGAGAKRLRVATTEDLEKYLEQLSLLPKMSNITNPLFISWIVKPDFAR